MSLRGDGLRGLTVDEVRAQFPDAEVIGEPLRMEHIYAVIQADEFDGFCVRWHDRCAGSAEGSRES